MNQEKIKNILLEEGFRPAVDSDGDLVFKFEGKTYFIEVDKDDDMFIKLVLANFWKIETGEDSEFVHKLALEVTKSVKVAKIFPVNDQLWSSAELYLPNEESLEPILGRLLAVVTGAARHFSNLMEKEFTNNSEG